MKTIIKKLWLGLVFIGLATAGFAAEIDDALRDAKKIFAQIDANNAYIDKLENLLSGIELPVGLQKSINNTRITIAASDGRIDSRKNVSELDFFARLEIGAKDTIFFGVKGVKLSYSGDIVGDARLVLLKNQEIPIGGEYVILRLLGSFDMSSGNMNDLTYVEIDCSGFKSLGLSAEIELSPALCRPVADSTGRPVSDTTARVVGKFKTQIAGLDDILAAVTFPSFEIIGLNGFVWNIKDAVFDFSDVRNDTKVQFPSGYNQYLIQGNEKLWNGVYVSELSVTLPPQFERSGNDTAAAYASRISFAAENMLIDENGITGLFSGDNILPISEGNASGWEFSLDHFHLRLMANTLEEVAFNGDIGIPLAEKKRFGYNGLIAADNKYMLQVITRDTIPFDIFMAHAEIDPNSYIELKVNQGKFRPKALLHGRMSLGVKMNENSTSNIAEFKGIVFRSLLLQTESPYFGVEYMGYNDEIKYQGFPISLSNIELKTTDTEALLGFNMKLALMDGGLGAETRLEIVGELPQGKIHKWKFKKLNIHDIEINATISEIMKIRGSLSIKNDDPIYGDGFGGNLTVDFTGGPIGGLTAEMRGMFGKTDFRYWFIDGKANMPGNGIPVLGILNLKGFGGGLTYRMKGTGKNQSGENVHSVTGMEYVPDKNYSLGVKASAAFTIISDEAASGEACFELAFNEHGGLNYAGFYGFAKFMGTLPGLNEFQDKVGDAYKNLIEIEKEAYSSVGGENGLKNLKQYNPNEAGALYTDKDRISDVEIKATLGLQFNFAESSFHASFEVYVSAIGGMIRGVGQNNRAGIAVIHVDPESKYIYMGTPTDRIGLKIGLGSLLNVETGSYLMAGNPIPDAPPPPPQVASILGVPAEDLNYMGNLNALADGKGFAFGSHLSINTGDITFLILYARFSAGLGFDIMIRDYGDAECEGRSGAIGIDGWYANGQAYAYLSGELGVKVNLWFIKARIPIITADFAALLQAKLPNPASFKAYIAVKAKVLGIVSVNCRFKLSIGEECNLVIPGGSPVDMIMITDLSPSDASSDVDVFTAPNATFAMEIGKPFTVQDDDGEKVYKIQLKDFILNDGAGNIIGNVKWNSDKDEASFYSHEVLPSQKEITATVRVSFEQYANNRWSTVYTGGQEAMEIKTINFTTGDAPDYIPLRNVVYSYPVVDQKYYLKNEQPAGYVQLEFGQNYLFPPELENKVCIEDNAGNKLYADFVYNAAQKRIDYTMPEVQNQTQYKFNILSFNKGDTPTATSTTVSQSLMDDDELGNIDIETQTAVSESRTDIGKVLLDYEFASSRYSTFKQKIDNIVKGSAAVIKLDSDVLMFEYETVDMEAFDLAELTGSAQTENKPLIRLEAALDESFYTAKIRPLLYEDYPVQGLIRIANRDVNIFGVPPSKALPIMTDYLNEIENNNFYGLATKRFPYYYNLPQIYKFDFINLQSQVINAYLNNTSNPAYQRFINATYPFISPGNYRINLKYNMPGGITGTSSTFSYRNFIQ
ncbi:MAG: hypothetical protein LBP63_00760 [Prevotellaceae bacterium]|jgi:hypothetical protein|nr:hypothetical protein [Prevotellaceae bacterium]